MRFSRHSRIVTALIALFSVLFMQLAVAAYACPAIQDEAMHSASTASHEEMPGCDGMVDVDQRALCFAYSQEGSQSLYTPPIPDIQPAMVIELVRIIDDIRLVLQPVYSPVQASRLMRASDPPLSIRNCCFRI